MPGPEEPEQAPLSPDYVPGPDAAYSPILPVYIADSDPEDESEDGPMDYPVDEGDDDDESLGDERLTTRTEGRILLGG
ncbi:hypothetical protein Tco_0694527 [Tanacetum coccineum]